MYIYRIGKTRNKRRAKKFRKSRELQLKKKATRRQLKGGSFPTEEEFETVSTQVTTINKTMGVIIQSSSPYRNGLIEEDDRNLVDRVLHDNYPYNSPPPPRRLLEDKSRPKKKIATLPQELAQVERLSRALQAVRARRVEGGDELNRQYPQSAHL